MTDQNKSTKSKQGSTQSKTTEEGIQQNAATLTSILCNKYEMLAKIPDMKFPASYIFGCVVAVIIIFCWKQIAVGQVESNMTKQLASDRITMADEARAYADQQYAQEEQRFGQVLSWAVRSELIRGNLDQVSQYLNEVVKMKDTEMVVLFDNDGELLLATDKRLEDPETADVYSDDIMKQRDIKLISNVDDRKLLVVPVMGLNTRLGTIVVSYEQSTLN